MQREMLTTIVFITINYFVSLIEFDMAKIKAFTIFGWTDGFSVGNRTSGA